MTQPTNSSRFEWQKAYRWPLTIACGISMLLGVQLGLMYTLRHLVDFDSVDDVVILALVYSCFITYTLLPLACGIWSGWRPGRWVGRIVPALSVCLLATLPPFLILVFDFETRPTRVLRLIPTVCIFTTTTFALTAGALSLPRLFTSLRLHHFDEQYAGGDVKKLQFSLKWMMLLTTAVAVLLAYLSVIRPEYGVHPIFFAAVFSPPISIPTVIIARLVLYEQASRWERLLDLLLWMGYVLLTIAAVFIWDQFSPIYRNAVWEVAGVILVLNLWLAILSVVAAGVLRYGGYRFGRGQVQSAPAPES